MRAGSSSSTRVHDRRGVPDADGRLNDTTVKFVRDTAGQERYYSLAPMYYRGAAAAIVVYDITNRDTFQRAKQWVKELQRQGNPNIVIALAGNKSDLNREAEGRARGGRVVRRAIRRSYRAIRRSRGAIRRAIFRRSIRSLRYANDNGIFFMETSAKTAANVNELFVAIARKLLKNTPQQRPGQQGIVIANNAAADQKKAGGCC